MKSLEQLYEEIKTNEELKKEFVAAFKEGKAADFLKKYEYDASAEDFAQYINSLKSGAISDDDLEKVAGGICTTHSCNGSCDCYTYSEFYC